MSRCIVAVLMASVCLRLKWAVIELHRLFISDKMPMARSRNLRRSTPGRLEKDAANLRSSSKMGSPSVGNCCMLSWRACSKCWSGWRWKGKRGANAALWLIAPTCCPSAVLIFCRTEGAANTGLQLPSMSSPCWWRHRTNRSSGCWFTKSSTKGMATPSNHSPGYSFLNANAKDSCRM